MIQAKSTLIAVVLAGIAAFWGSIALAQNVFVQIEAHANSSVAQDRAVDFANVLENVNGFRLGSGWYAIAIGPFSEDVAIARMQTLKSQRRIPGDSFLVDQAAYSGQFYPNNGTALTSPAVTSSQSQTAEAETTVEPTAPVEPPEETRREALRSERDLTRQEKFNLQIAMQWFGFYDGAIDAAFGPGTRNSMANWQSSKGFEPTGVLTTRQRSVLTGEYEAILASLDLQPTQDTRAGINITLPNAMVKFDRYEPPFAHYNAINDSGVKVLLISQTGDENTLLGLYDIMQTLEIVPLEGERTRQSNRFTLTGQNDTITSYTHAVLDGNTIKGFSLIWPTGDDQRREVVRKAMRDSFEAIDGAVLPDSIGDGTLEQSIDLVSGLEIRRPESARSGFYIDGLGSVLTTLTAVQNCGRVTLDEIYEADVVASETTLGLALLRPKEALAPLDYARFQPGQPRLKSEIAVAGYSFEGMLGAPTMTFGTLSDVKGLRGEDTIKRLALAASTGDAGGPVFDSTGSVLGMLLPKDDTSGKQLPADVSFATDSLAIAEFLSNNGVSAAASDNAGPMHPEDMTKQAVNLTVLVSCWK